MKILFISILVYFLFRDPKCPNCKSRTWKKNNLWYQWQCNWCYGWYDPILKVYEKDR